MVQRLRLSIFMGLLLGSTLADVAALTAQPNEPARGREHQQSQNATKNHEPEPKRVDHHGTTADAKSDASKRLDREERFEIIRGGLVWQPTDVARMNLRKGPQGKGAFAPGALVTCNYVDEKMSGGASRKFNCSTGSDVLKVRYGADNGEVFGSVLASRLLWALGFGADAVYPVRVRCRGCSADPWNSPARVRGHHTFELAAIERKPAGRQIGADEDGWTWPELALINEAKGGSPVAHADALTLLAVMIQHTDSKALQQRIWCQPRETRSDGNCRRAFLMIHDVGLTFGGSNFKNKPEQSSVNFTEWSETPVWRDDRECVGYMKKSFTGTLSDPIIGEAGRAFLARLLQQLTDRQLYDLFDVARVDRRSRNPEAGGEDSPASVREWVSAFKHKRDQIVSRRCA